MNISQARFAALDTAARLGLPHNLTLQAARAYLAFLEGKEPVPMEWSLASSALPPEILKRARAEVKKLGTKQTLTATRKPASRTR